MNICTQEKEIHLKSYCFQKNSMTSLVVHCSEHTFDHHLLLVTIGH